MEVNKATRKITFKAFFFIVIIVTVACFVGLLTNNLGFGFFFALVTLVSLAMLCVVIRWRCKEQDDLCFGKVSDFEVNYDNNDIESNSENLFSSLPNNEPILEISISNSTLGPLRPLPVQRELLRPSSSNLTRTLMLHSPDMDNGLRGGVMSDTNLFIVSPPPYSTFDGNLPSYEQLEEANRAYSEGTVQNQGMMLFVSIISLHTVGDTTNHLIFGISIDI